MMPRTRKYHTGVDNLYLDPTNGGYRYKHPITGKFTRMGIDLAKAKAAARILNDRLTRSPDYVNKVAGVVTIAAFAKTFQNDILPGLGLAISTLRDYKNKLKHIATRLNHEDIASVGVMPIATFLDTFPDRQSNLYRSVLILIFKHAIAKGVRPLEATNPAVATLPKAAAVKRQRLTPEAYRMIHAASESGYQRAMELALISLQRREDLTRFRRQDVVASALQFQQHKTGAPLRISLDVNLEGVALGQVIERCKDIVGVQHLLHYGNTARRPFVGKPMSPGSITKAFSEVRDRLGICSDLPPRERPSFHEIRALGAKLYEQAGYPQKWINLLLGHQTEEMTTLYLSRHEVKWIEVNAI